MLFTFVHLKIAALALLGASMLLAAEQCDDYFMGQKGRWAVCPNYCCGSLFYRTCCSNCFQAYPTRSCYSPAPSRPSTIFPVLVVLAVLFLLLATIAVIVCCMKCCAARIEEETVLIAPYQPTVTVTAQYPGTSGEALPPYPGAPPAYGTATSYSQTPGVVVVKQSTLPPAAVIAPPLIAPMPLLMPVPFGGFGEHHYHYGGGGNMDAPLAVGDYGGFDATIASGFN